MASKFFDKNFKKNIPVVFLVMKHKDTPASDGKPKKWYYAIQIIVVWLIYEVFRKITSREVVFLRYRGTLLVTKEPSPK